MEYAATVTRDTNGTYLVTFPDVPGANSFGETPATALAHGLDALLSIFDDMIRDRQPIPTPATKGKYFVEVPTLEAAKVALYQSMIEQKVNKAELGRRLEVFLPQVDRLLNVRHASNFSQVDKAFRVMGKRIELRVVDAPPMKMPGAVVAAAKAGRSVKVTARPAASGQFSARYVKAAKKK